MSIARAIRGAVGVSPRYHHDEILLRVLGFADVCIAPAHPSMSGSLTTMPMDTTNRKILEVLTRDARMSYADLARAVGRAESTVRERVGALERRGVIKGYQAVVDTAEIGLTARGIVRASFDLRNIKALESALQAIPQVRRVVLSTGAHPLLVEIAAKDLMDFEHILEERLAPLELSNVETDLFVREIVAERPVLSSSLSSPLVQKIEDRSPSLKESHPSLERSVATVGPRTL